MGVAPQNSMPHPWQESRTFVTCINHSLAADYLPPRESIASGASLGKEAPSGEGCM